jgi:hypothetical protein
MAYDSTYEGTLFGYPFPFIGAEPEGIVARHPPSQFIPAGFLCLQKLHKS